MLLVLSPAKSLDYETPAAINDFTLPEFITESAQLIGVLKKFSLADIANLMGLSDKLAALNVARYEQWSKKFTATNSKQAILAFNGDVYEGFDAATLNKKGFKFAQDHIRILSGLYGILRPLDLMQPYRLEMGTSLVNSKGKDLYAYWGDKLTLKLKEDLQSHKNKILLNLASDEYFKAVRPEKLGAEVISPVFLDEKSGKYKIISFYAKRARGLMARFIVDHQIDRPEDLKGFDYEGYEFNAKDSTSAKPVFRRKEQA